MEPFDWIIDEVTIKLGAKPGTHRWEIITACFGWAALVSLLLSFGGTIFGYKTLGLYGMTAFNTLLWIALKRDFKKLRGTMAKSHITRKLTGSQTLLETFLKDNFFVGREGVRSEKQYEGCYYVVYPNEEDANFALLTIPNGIKVEII